MDRLIYLANWGNDKKTAWSGTRYALYKALCNYFKVDDINLKISKVVNIVMNRVFHLDSTSKEYHGRKLLRLKLRHIKGKVFQFSEVLLDNNKRETFLYVDNTVSYLNYMRRNLPQIYEMSGFLTTNSKITDKREGEQTSYMNSCKGVLTMGHWLRDWLISQGLSADKVHAVGGGTNVDVNLIKPQQKTNNKILFIGKDFKRKGGYITYDAFKILRDQGEKVELYVIGPNVDPIGNPIEGYHFIGQIPFEEEAKYYNMCDVFCIPSYFEAYGLVFVEALIFGLPCIGRNCYEMPYFIKDGETGLLLSKDDPNELANYIMRILEDDTFSKNVISRRKKYIQEYSWDTVAQRIAKVIKK